MILKSSPKRRFEFKYIVNASINYEFSRQEEYFLTFKKYSVNLTLVIYCFLGPRRGIPCNNLNPCALYIIVRTQCRYTHTHTTNKHTCYHHLQTHTKYTLTHKHTKNFSAFVIHINLFVSNYLCQHRYMSRSSGGGLSACGTFSARGLQYSCPEGE